MFGHLLEKRGQYSFRVERQVAEGIETESVLGCLREVGVNKLQGYYFSKPLPADQLLEYVEKTGIPGRIPGGAGSPPPKELAA